MVTVKQDTTQNCYNRFGADCLVLDRATALKTGDPDGEQHGQSVPSLCKNPFGDNYAGADVKSSGGAGGKAPAGGVVSGYYLEYVDNVSEVVAKSLVPKSTKKEGDNWIEKTCDVGRGYFITAECENGHRFAKELVCNKEWCGKCGEDGSHAHNRRIARWLPKVMELDSLGYWVFTIPEGLRARYRAKKALSELGHRVQELLKSYGYSRGLRRWHWFGEISKLGLRDDPVFHPHLNLITDGRYVHPDTLEAIKRGYEAILGSKVVDVNYRYRRSAAEKWHTLSYVTRATFTSPIWDDEMAHKIRGFRNMVVWGRGEWGGEPAWNLEDLDGKAKSDVDGMDLGAVNSLIENICPDCGKELRWGVALPIALLGMVKKEDLGAGYYRLETRPPLKGLPPAVKDRLYWKEVIKRANLRLDRELAIAEAKAEKEEYQGWWLELLPYVDRLGFINDV
ncbi:hypothetical protein ES708_19054 [subsurface metagenome]